MGFFAHFCRFRTSPRGGFYINPSRRGPVTPFLPVLGPGPGNPHFGGFCWIFPNFGGIRGFGPQRALGDPGSPRPAPAGDRAPPRGVDVKPPSREGVAGGHARAGQPQGPFRTPEGVPEASPGPQGPGSPPGPCRGRGFYINPSRRGPVPGRGTPPGLPGATPSQEKGAGG